MIISYLSNRSIAQQYLSILEMVKIILLTEIGVDFAESIIGKDMS
jgi:hypothetical protein